MNHSLITGDLISFNPVLNQDLLFKWHRTIKLWTLSKSILIYKCPPITRDSQDQKIFKKYLILNIP